MIRPVTSGVIAWLTMCPGHGNRPPVVHDISLRTAEDTPLVVRKDQLRISDPDGDRVEVRLLTPGHGTLSGSNPWTYRPYGNYSGRETIRIQASDGRVTSTATLTIDVTAVNDAPVAVDDTLTTVE